MRNYYQDDDRLEAEDCPCANSEDGYDDRCPQHHADYDRDLDTRCTVHAARACTTCAEAVA